MKYREVVSEAQNCSPERITFRTITTIREARAKIQENAENKTLGQIIYETIANEIRKNTKDGSRPTL
jgi:DNA-binding IscR family transcriptional regulator